MARGYPIGSVSSSGPPPVADHHRVVHQALRRFAHHEMVVEAVSSKERPFTVQCSAGTRADGTTVIDPWAPRRTNRVTTLTEVPWSIVAWDTTNQVGPSALFTATTPPPSIVMSVARAGRLAAMRPTYPP